jgi:hypothetical protein
MSDHDNKSMTGEIKGEDKAFQSGDESQGVRQADQAEGERNNAKSAKVTRTPDQAEGSREDVEENIRQKEDQGKL